MTLNPFYTRTLALSLIASVLMSGCAVTPADVTKKEKQIAEQVDTAVTQAKNQRQQERALTVVPGNFVGGQSVELPYSSTLPPIFFQKIVINPAIRGFGSISQAAININLATGIPVRVNPDLFFEDKIEETKALGRPIMTAQAPGQQKTTPGVLTPKNMVLDDASEKISQSPIKRNVPLDYNGQFIDYLNMVAASSGVEWQYLDGAIEFSRFQTKVFYLKASPGEIDFSTGMTKGGGSNTAGGTGSNYTSNTSATFTGHLKVWKQLELAVKAALSLRGKAIVNDASGSVTVVDYRENVARVQSIIERENNVLGRQVSVEVKTIVLQVDESSLLNLSISTIWSALNGSASGGASAAYTNTLASGTTGYSIATGPFAGSKINLTNLNDIGKVVSSESTNAVTSNRVPVMLGKFTSTYFVSAATAGTVGANGVVTGATQTTTPLTTGSFFHMIPTIGENNSLLLNLSIERSNLDGIQNLVTGVGTSQTTVQLPQTSGTQSTHNVTMGQNETLILMGVNNDLATAGNRWSTGAVGTSNSKTKYIQIMIVTPRIMQGV